MDYKFYITIAALIWGSFIVGLLIYSLVKYVKTNKEYRKIKHE